MTLSSKKTKYKGKNYYKANQKFLDIKKQAVRQGVESGVAIHKNERGNGGIDAFVNVAATLCVTLYIRLCNKGITIVSLLLSEHGQCRRMFTSRSAITSDLSRTVGQCYHMG